MTQTCYFYQSGDNINVKQVLKVEFPETYETWRLYAMTMKTFDKLRSPPVTTTMVKVVKDEPVVMCDKMTKTQTGYGIDDGEIYIGMSKRGIFLGVTGTPWTGSSPYSFKIDMNSYIKLLQYESYSAIPDWETRSYDDE